MGVCSGAHLYSCFVLADRNSEFSTRYLNETTILVFSPARRNLIKEVRRLLEARARVEEKRYRCRAQTMASFSGGGQ